MNEVGGKVLVHDATSGRFMRVSKFQSMPGCGNRGIVDDSGGYPAYRCETCNALEGSMGVPQDCQLLIKLAS